MVSATPNAASPTLANRLVVSATSTPSTATAMAPLPPRA